VRLEGLGKLKKSTSSGIRSRNLPACSIVSTNYATAYPNNCKRRYQLLLCDCSSETLLTFVKKPFDEYSLIEKAQNKMCFKKDMFSAYTYKHIVLEIQQTLGIKIAYSFPVYALEAYIRSSADSCGSRHGGLVKPTVVQPSEYDIWTLNGILRGCKWHTMRAPHQYLHMGAVRRARSKFTTQVRSFTETVAEHHGDWRCPCW
jgi:hypothetical protein